MRRRGQPPAPPPPERPPPKPLLELDGRSLLDHALDRIAAAGVADAVVNAHWRGEQIAAAMDRRAAPRITLQREETLLETGGAILPLGRILTPGRRLVFPDETVSRAGERVTRHFQHTRWIDGGSLLWMGRRRRSGRGEGSSGLRFDSVS